ncbi:hypothetical protein VQ056_29555 [Paenibacillus sp. JTLBN-2024]
MEQIEFQSIQTNGITLHTAMAEPENGHAACTAPRVSTEFGTAGKIKSSPWLRRAIVLSFLIKEATT